MKFGGSYRKFLRRLNHFFILDIFRINYYNILSLENSSPNLSKKIALLTLLLSVHPTAIVFVICQKITKNKLRFSAKVDHIPPQFSSKLLSENVDLLFSKSCYILEDPFPLQLHFIESQNFQEYD